MRPRVDVLLQRMDERARGVCDVRYRNVPAHGPVWGSVEFDPEGSSFGPVVTVARVQGEGHDDLLVELFALAYAVGHQLSWHRGAWSPVLKRAHGCLRRGDSGGVSTTEALAYLAEEARAWELARDELVAVGFRDWYAFDDQRDLSLEAASDYVARYTRGGDRDADGF